MSISKKLVIMFLLAIMSLFISISTVSYLKMKSQLIADYHRSLSADSSSLKAYVALQSDAFHNTCSSFVTQPICGSLLETEDEGTIIDGMQPLSEQLQMSNMLFADFDGDFLVELSGALDDFSADQLLLLQRI
ncbi:MAG: hypothetical protein HRU15_17615 [Planctomycetes bacterium]|nr:hypothetical protein [Planctomycetota bacterium]